MSEMAHLIKQFCILIFVYWNKISLDISEMKNVHSFSSATLKYKDVVQTD